MRFLVAILIAIFCGICHARAPAVRAEFQRLNPCPSTGERRGPCPGWVGDHIIPLCAGGADSVENMQWQTIAASLDKDSDERDLCRKIKSIK